MSLLESILNLDTYLLKWVNIQMSNPVFDMIMSFIDKPKFFILPLIGLWFFSIYKLSARRWQIALMIPLGILITDQTGTAIKKMELRQRPWTVHEDINHLGGKGGKAYSFPSNHAANSTLLATVFSFFYPQLNWILFTFAGIVAYSRVYIGVHYPLDILAGIILGWAVARLLINLAEKYFFVNSAKHHPAS